MKHTRKLLSLLLVLALVLSFAPMALAADGDGIEQAQTVETAEEIPAEETEEAAEAIEPVAEPEDAESAEEEAEAATAETEDAAEDEGDEDSEPVELKLEDAELLGDDEELEEWSDYAAGITGSTTLTGTGVEGDPFLIGTADELAVWAYRCNQNVSGYQASYVELMANIDLGGKNWTPIYDYSGTFDGDGFAIINMTIEGTSTADDNWLRRFGFFASLRGSAHNVTFVSPSITATKTGGAKALMAGVLAGMMYGRAERIGVEGGSVSAAWAGTVIICGVCDVYTTTGSVTNCYVTGLTIEASGTDVYAGGIGTLEGSATIANCFFDGTVSTTATGSTHRRGAVVEYNAGTSTGNYYNSETWPDGDDGPLNAAEATGLSTEEMQSWDFVYTLNGESLSADTWVWTRRVDSYPVFGGLSWEDVMFAHYEKDLAIDGWTEPEPESDGTYVLDSAEDLAWFAYQVNVANRYVANAWNIRLDADIDLAGAAYSEAGDIPVQWVPISNYGYGGDFDGQGFTIRNMTITRTGLADAERRAGFFAQMYRGTVHDMVFDSATVRVAKATGVRRMIAGVLVAVCLGDVCNVGVSNSEVWAYGSVGTLAAGLGDMDTVYGIARGCYVVSSSVDAYGPDVWAGGLAVSEAGGYVVSCYFDGTVQSSASGSIHKRGVVAMYSPGTTLNNYYNSETWASGSGAFLNAAAATGRTTAEMKTWDFVYELAGGRISADNWFWSYYSGNYPVFGGLSWEDVMRANAEKSFPLGTWTAPAPSDGVYVLDSAEDLAWFAYQINVADRDTAKTWSARLDADIDLTGSEYGGTAERPVQWVPIYSTGDSTAGYDGSFDGGGHTISNLFIRKLFLNRNGRFQGLFGVIGDAGSVANVILDGPSIYAVKRFGNNALMIGGVAGIVLGTVQRVGLYEADLYAADWTGQNAYAMGIGDAYKATGSVSDCFVFGSVKSASRAYTRALGLGVVEASGTFANSYFAGTAEVVSGDTTGEGVIRLMSGTVENIVYDSNLLLSSTETAGVSAVTSTVLQSRATAIQLNNGRTGSEAPWTFLGGYPTFGTLPEAPTTWAQVAATLQEKGFGAATNTVAPEGTGTSDDPYLISTAEQLAWWAYQVNEQERFDACVRLTGDIDLAGTVYSDDGATKLNWTRVGTSTIAYGSKGGFYTGEFDGNGRTIRNMTIIGSDFTDENRYQGFFGQIGPDGVVHDLYFADPQIAVTKSAGTGAFLVGVVAGVIRGEVYRIGVTLAENVPVSVSSASGNAFAMGIGDACNGGVIRNCYVFGDFTATGNSGARAVLIGFNESGAISGCYGVGTAAATGKISNSFSGLAYGNSVGNCYYDSSVMTPSHTWLPGTGLPTAEMKSWKLAYGLNGGALGDTAAWTYTAENEYPVWGTGLSAFEDEEGSYVSGDTLGEELRNANGAITLLGDVNAGSEDLAVNSSTTLNLAGNTITTGGYLALFGGTVTDSSMTSTSLGGGLLKLGTNGMLAGSVKNGGALPIYDAGEGGYRFVDFTVQKRENAGSNLYTGVSEDGGTVYISFIPIFGESYEKSSAANYATPIAPLLASKADSHVTVSVRMEYTLADGRVCSTLYEMGDGATDSEGSLAYYVNRLGVSSGQNGQSVKLTLTGFQGLKNRCLAGSTISFSVEVSTDVGMFRVPMLSVAV